MQREEVREVTLLPAKITVVLPKRGRGGKQALHGPQGRQWQHVVVDAEEGRGGGRERGGRGGGEGIGQHLGGEAVGEAQALK